jgi:UDP-N-acetyl-D-mannosaminuronic acid transferase (WecB/TagA/CpsF family)
MTVPAGGRHWLLGLPCDSVTMAQAVQFAEDAVASGGFHSVLFSNAAKVVVEERDPELASAVAGAPLVVASGGSFDVVAGLVRRAPRLWQRLGLEWFWRVVQEPRRLWKRYLTTNTRFLVMLARAWLGRGARAGGGR